MRVKASKSMSSPMKMVKVMVEVNLGGLLCPPLLLMLLTLSLVLLLLGSALAEERSRAALSPDEEIMLDDDVALRKGNSELIALFYGKSLPPERFNQAGAKNLRCLSLEGRFTTAFTFLCCSEFMRWDDDDACVICSFFLSFSF